MFSSCFGTKTVFLSSHFSRVFLGFLTMFQRSTLWNLSDDNSVLSVLNWPDSELTQNVEITDWKLSHWNIFSALQFLQLFHMSEIQYSAVHFWFIYMTEDIRPQISYSFLLTDSKADELYWFFFTLLYPHFVKQFCHSPAGYLFSL